MGGNDTLKKDFGTMTWVLIPTAIALNIVIGQVVSMLKLPVYMDCIGTVMVGAACGPLAGALTGALSNVVWGMFSPGALPFFPVAAWIGFAAGMCARYGLFQSWWKVAITGLVVALTTPFVATPIVVKVYGGVEGSGASLITAILIKSGQKVTSAAFLKNLMIEPLDKIPTALFAYAILSGLPRRIKDRLPRAEKLFAPVAGEA